MALHPLARFHAENTIGNGATVVPEQLLYATRHHRSRSRLLTVVRATIVP